MVITNIPQEFGKLLWCNRITRSEICRIFDIAPGNLSRLLHKPLPTPQFVDILEALGYDIEIRFVRKEGSDE